MIYLITNRHLVSEKMYYNNLKEFSSCGLKRIILREKDLPSKELENVYINIKNVVKDDAKIIINSDIDLARRVKAYGIQLSFKDFLEYKKQDFKDPFVIGVSIHSLEEAILAEELGATKQLFKI